MEDAITVTPTEVLEHLFCPRFTYFMSVLSIPQREEKRYKVQMGREVHHQKQKHNRAYLRKKLGVIKREFGVYLSAPKYHLRGQVDEVLTLSDGTMAPLDYKFAEWKGRVYKGYRMQLVLYGLLIRENYPEARGVKKGFLVYTRSNNFIKEISIYEKDFQSAIRILQEIIEVVQNGKLPRRTRSKRRCMDCCYKNICV
ncbi:MAG: CRISPR-associated protein Cas4 [Calditrichaeota bacterium]|nr:MAG: CRISPR-associated protein Cas4 [Calditrichota bacterium]